eukprot:scaffold323769_cov50-Prasinocladus_malaysianus.AAC.1
MVVAFGPRARVPPGANALAFAGGPASSHRSDKRLLDLHENSSESPQGQWCGGALIGEEHFVEQVVSAHAPDPLHAQPMGGSSAPSRHTQRERLQDLPKKEIQ